MQSHLSGWSLLLIDQCADQVLLCRNIRQIPNVSPLKGKIAKGYNLPSGVRKTARKKTLCHGNVLISQLLFPELPAGPHQWSPAASCSDGNNSTLVQRPNHKRGLQSRFVRVAQTEAALHPDDDDGSGEQLLW